jgi:hypothetical protein
MIGSLHTQGSQIRPRLLTHQGAAEFLRKLATRLRGGAQDSFVIFDLGDDTYHAGEGAWTDNPDEALRYESEEKAQRGIEEVDCDAILRDRLVIRSADLA